MAHTLGRRAWFRPSRGCGGFEARSARTSTTDYESSAPQAALGLAYCDRVPSTEPEVLEVQLPSVRLSCLAWGPADGPLVVALHGFPDTAQTWRHLGPYLAERGGRGVAPYLRGYAPSGLADDGCYHVGGLMADAVALAGEPGGAH